MVDDKTKILAWCYDYSYNPNQELLFIKKLRERGFSDSDIVKVLDVMDRVCPHCFDGDNSCQCFNDE